MKGLTEKQRKIIDFIEDFTESKSIPPTIYEIAEHFKIKAPTISFHLKSLSKKGFVQRSEKARTVTVSAKYSEFRRKPKPAAKVIPLIKDLSNFDSIRSGDHIAEQYLAIDKSLFSEDADEFIFAMKMPDFALSAAGINSGDIVFFKYQTEVPNGTIAAIFARGKTFVRIYNTHGKDTSELSEAGEKACSATFQKKDIKPCGAPISILRKSVYPLKSDEK